MGFPVVAKISARDLLHKTEAGGVIVSLRTTDEVRQAAADLLASAAARGLADAGVLIQSMVAGGVETMIGVTHDPLFGPLVGFGLGGTEVELEQDIHFRSAPLTDRDASDLIRESRALPRLTGYRGRPPGDITSLTNVLLRVSRMASDLPQLLELDLNPVIVRPDGHGCAVVDARVKVGAPHSPRKVD
jgi:acetyltransferase